MKVLLPIIYHELTECIERAFQEEGHETLVVNWRQWSKDSRKHLIEPETIKAAKAFRPDFAFCQFQAPGLISAKLPLALREMGCFAVNWSGDVRHPLPDWYKELAPHFAVTSFTNVPDVDEIRAMGHRAEFLQIGYDERLYCPGNDERSGVVFIGNNYSGYKYAESGSRREMVKRMAAEFGPLFKVYGMCWETEVPAENVGGYLREPMDADVLRKALVAVGWDHFHRPGFASDRLLRATACGCATVNQYYLGIEEEHPSVGAAKDIDQMVAMVWHALNNPQEARQVGQMAAVNTLKQHRWNERVRQMMTWLQDHSGK